MKRPAPVFQRRPLHAERGRFRPCAFWTRRVTTQDLVLEIGRLSAISTTSPILYSPFSSCAWYLLDLATILPYSSCLVRRSISTVIVFERLSLTTLPIRVRVFLARGSAAACGRWPS